MKKSNKPIVNTDVVLRKEFDDWAVLFDPTTSDAVGMSPPGVVVWEMMDGQHNIQEIAAAMDDHFSGVPDTIAEEVTAFVDELVKRGFAGYEINDEA